MGSGWISCRGSPAWLPVTRVSQNHSPHTDADVRPSPRPAQRFRSSQRLASKVRRSILPKSRGGREVVDFTLSGLLVW